MAIKERLLKQLQNVRDGLCAMPPFHSRDLQTMRNALVQARDLCFQGLPRNRFAEYQDTYDGLLLAIDQLAADVPDKEEIVSLCADLLQYTIAQTQKETAFKKELFFLPYKASMWDSLESVWKAANEDKEHCIAYVMPIPYADLTPEHTVAEWHYEGGMFPKEVPIVNWEDIDLQEIHPDVIFIHNPYDEYNRVTSVESRYYSSKLKDQTDKLVYIPYFVLAEPEFDGKSEEEIEKIEEGIAHFVLTPAVLNAHQVIVQSEAMREVYINVLTRQTDKTDRAFWEKRILGTGSPKFDKVAMTKKEDLDVPKEWLQIIEKPDGSWKKIVFYNTGLVALLQNEEKMLAKMRQVFQTFKEYQEEIALLWRPHPLIPATIKSMRPQLEKAYEEIVQQYKEDGWGIYDDSGDLDRAIVLSDAYYGDGSSIIELYKKTNKPILNQSYDSIDYILYTYDNMCSDGKKVWYVSLPLQVLFEIDLQTAELKCLGGLPGYEGDSRAFRGIVYKDGHIYVIPNKARHVILDYEIKNKLFISHKIPSNIFLENETESGFFGCVEYKNYIYMFGIHPLILRFDTKTFEFKAYRQWLSEIYEQNAPCFFWHAYHVNMNFLRLHIGTKNYILELNMDTDEIKFYNIGNGQHGLGINCMAFDGINYWFSLVYGGYKLIQWNINSNITTEYEIHDENLPKTNAPFYSLEYGNGILWLLAANGEKSYKFYTNSNKFIEIINLPTVPKEALRNELKYNYHCGVRVNSGLFVTLNLDLGILVKCDFNRGDISSEKIQFTKDTKEKLSKLFHSYFSQISSLHNRAESYMELNCFLNNIKTSAVNSMGIQKNEYVIFVGEKIYRDYLLNRKTNEDRSDYVIDFGKNIYYLLN